MIDGIREVVDSPSTQDSDSSTPRTAADIAQHTFSNVGVLALASAGAAAADLGRVLQPLVGPHASDPGMQAFVQELTRQAAQAMLATQVQVLASSVGLTLWQLMRQNMALPTAPAGSLLGRLHEHQRNAMVEITRQAGGDAARAITPVLDSTLLTASMYSSVRIVNDPLQQAHGLMQHRLPNLVDPQAALLDPTPQPTWHLTVQARPMRFTDGQPAFIDRETLRAMYPGLAAAGPAIPPDAQLSLVPGARMVPVQPLSAPIGGLVYSRLSPEEPAPDCSSILQCLACQARLAGHARRLAERDQLEELALEQRLHQHWLQPHMQPHMQPHSLFDDLIELLSEEGPAATDAVPAAANPQSGPAAPGGVPAAPAAQADEQAASPESARSAGSGSSSSGSKRKRKRSSPSADSQQSGGASAQAGRKRASPQRSAEQNADRA